MFNRLLNTVYRDLVSETEFVQRTFLNGRHSRQKGPKDPA
jgi:hypothetical protein